MMMRAIWQRVRSGSMYGRRAREAGGRDGSMDALISAALRRPSWWRIGLRHQDRNKTKRAALAMRTVLDVNSGDALPEGAHGFWGGRCPHERGRLECCARLSKQDSLVAVGEQAVMPDAVEAAGQHVKREAAQEFDGLEVHDSSAPAVRVVLVAKAHRSFIGEHHPFSRRPRPPPLTPHTPHPPPPL